METNFKVDMPSFALGYSAGKKKGGGESGKPVVEKDVNFYDYDGTLLHSYTVEEAQKLTALPKLPEQPGLICQEWNWTLDEIKERNGKVDVGATYTTDDGRTRLYITIPEDGRTTITITMETSNATGDIANIDWGDGNPPENTKNQGRYTISHTYERPGDYVISIHSLTLIFGQNSSSYNFMGYTGEKGNFVYYDMLRKVELGENVNRIASGTFSDFAELESITIPSGLSVLNIESYAFSECENLKFITIPRGTKSFGQYAFEYCSKLEHVSVPNTVTTIGNKAFQYCTGLKRIVIPHSVTTINADPFSNSESLSEIEFTRGMESIGQVFYNCYGLREVTIPDTIKSIGNNCFSYCLHLKKVNMPNSVETIGVSAFADCYVLSKITIPKSVTTIQGYAFNNCKGMKIFDFTSFESVPVLGNSNAFSNVASDYEIRVPVALYDEWIAATNWSSVKSRIVAV